MSAIETVMQRKEAAATGVTWHEFTGPGPEFRHAMLTRLGGVSRGPFSSLNLGGTVGDDAESVEENHRRVFQALGISAEQVVSPHQVHSAEVAEVRGEDGDSVIRATDALITQAPDLVLLLRFADCVPVIFYDPVQHAVGLAHAGWRGVAAQVVPATVEAMAQRFGSLPETLWAGIGPAIGPDHYVVGPEVVAAVQRTLAPGVTVAARQNGRWHLDLAVAVKVQLAALGIRDIQMSGVCTACDTTTWYSHRAEKGRTGRFGVLAWLASAS